MKFSTFRFLILVLVSLPFLLTATAFFGSDSLLSGQKKISDAKKFSLQFRHKAKAENAKKMGE